LWCFCLPCAASTSGDRKKSLQKAARAHWARLGVQKAGKMEAKARGDEGIPFGIAYGFRLSQYRSIIPPKDDGQGEAYSRLPIADLPIHHGVMTTLLIEYL
jgi:hypothetical protein